MKRALLYIVLLLSAIPSLAAEIHPESCVVNSTDGCDSFVTGNTTYSVNTTISSDVYVLSGGTLTITATVTMTNNARIVVADGGTVIVEGILKNARLQLSSGSSLTVRFFGWIKLLSGSELNIPSGAIMNIDCGGITYM